MNVKKCQLKKKISFNIYVFGGPAVRSHMGTYAYLRNGASEEKNFFCPEFLIFILPTYVRGTTFI